MFGKSAMKKALAKEHTSVSSRKKALTKHQEWSVPVALEAARQVLDQLGVQAQVVASTARDPRVGTQPKESEIDWWVSDSLTVSALPESGSWALNVLYTTWILRDGTIDLDRVREMVAQEIEEASRTGFSDFDFRMSLHTSDIPAGVAVEVDDWDHTSEAVTVALRDPQGGLLLHRRYVVGPLVYYGGDLMVAHKHSLYHPSTFIADCVHQAIADYQGVEYSGYRQHVPDLETASFDSMCRTMVADFRAHAELVRAVASNRGSAPQQQGSDQGAPPLGTGLDR